MRIFWQTFLRPDAAALQFASKTVIGAELAYWFALQLGLSQPLLAMLTAVIVAQPLSGMVIQKGLARLLGTLVGMLMAIVLMQVFACGAWLFLLLLSLWLGLCTAASTLLRSAWAYAFVLAGYTVAIICLPIMAEPQSIVFHALQRGAEISLGVVCATACSALLWPLRVERQMAVNARAAWQAGLTAAAALLRGENYARHGLLEALTRMVQVDGQREHAWFEGRRGRQRAAAMRVFSRDLLTLMRLARGVARQWRVLDESQAHALSVWLDALQDVFVAPDVLRFTELAGRLQQAAETGDLPVATQQCLARMVVLLRQALIGAAALQAVESGEFPAEKTPALSWHRDRQTAAFCGLRSALALAALALCWLLSGWLVLVGAMIVTSVICSLFANRENASQLGMGFLKGTLVAVPIAYLVGQVLLPASASFAWTMLGLGLPLFFGALGMVRPALAVSSIAFSLHFILLSAPQGQQQADLGLFIIEVLALLLGIGCALAAFKLVQLRNPHWHGRRLLKAMFEDLARLATRDLSGAENWFGGRMADRLLQLARHYPGQQVPQRNRWDDALSCLDLADELLHLRRCLTIDGSELDKDLRIFLSGFARLVRNGPQADKRDAVKPLNSNLAAALQHASSSGARRLALTALQQLQHAWSRCCEQAEPAGGATADTAQSPLGR